MMSRIGRGPRGPLVICALALGLVAGCTELPDPDRTELMPETQTEVHPPLPPMKRFGPVQPHRPQVSNVDLAQDFLDLSFKLESGRKLPVLTRFEEPVRIAVNRGTGPLPPTFTRDLDALIGRLRREAGVDIRMARGNERANLVVQPVRGADIRQELPDAACFVVPGITDLSEYRRAQRSGRTDWARLTKRDQIAIFVPGDAAPQELRDCLHEEMAQALGPLNDLYRLPDSTFNDDNMHPILTGYDMLILRLTYAPELHSGMTPAQVQARLPGLLARMNPQGQSIAPRNPRPTPRQWTDAVARALGPGSSPAMRLRGATDAVAIAEKEGWNDNRTAFSYYMLGRLTLRKSAIEAEPLLRHAHALYSALPDTALQAANVAAQLAGYDLVRDQPQQAIAMLRPAEAEARRHQDAALLAWCEMLEAQALHLDGQEARAESVRLDSLGWARYGFAPDWVIWNKLQIAASLNPQYNGD